MNLLFSVKPTFSWVKKQVAEKEAAGKNYLFVRLNRDRKNRGQKTPKIQIRPFKYVKELFKYKFKIKIVKLLFWIFGKLEEIGLRFWFYKRSTLILKKRKPTNQKSNLLTIQSVISIFFYLLNRRDRTHNFFEAGAIRKRD